MKVLFNIFLLILFTLNNLLLCAQLTDSSTNIISFFLKEYPEEGNNKVDVAKECNLLKNYFNNACKTLDVSHNFGVFATYAGYLSMSNQNGQIEFPRKVIKDSINVLVTNKISPVFMFAVTLAYWEIKDPNNTKMYKFERSQDPTTKLYYWEVSEKELPKSNRIPVQTIIIFAEPHEIYVPLGATLTRNNANLILPDIYVRKNINNISNMLFVLNFKPLFSKTNLLYKDIPLGYESLVVA